MATTFSSLPIVDLSALKHENASPEALADLSGRLHNVFATTGFAYLVNSPLSFSPEDVFGMASEFFALPEESKMGVAKRSFNMENQNTYRGYFPSQPDLASDNLKEGFEIGPPSPVQPAPTADSNVAINLAEPNMWPNGQFTARPRLEQLYTELQHLSSRLLSLLAMSLGKSPDFFDNYLVDSLSTLRLLHYPTTNTPRPRTDSGIGSSPETNIDVKLSCTPHTDSGLLTLLHQDSTGGLEVRESSGKWIAAPYIPGSIVVNIGDLMAKVSGGRFVATLHRVRAPVKMDGGEMGRFSVPFFFEPGEKCLVKSVDGDGDGDGDVVVYGEHVRAKMKTWVEFRDVE